MPLDVVGDRHAVVSVQGEPSRDGELRPLGPALHNATPTRKAITFHDLRATACTWAAIRGDSELQIRGRSGHETLSVLRDYVRDAEAIKEGVGTVFPELPTCLLGLASGQCPRSVPATPSFVAKFERDTGFESPSTTGTSQRNFPARSENAPAGAEGDEEGLSRWERFDRAVERATSAAASTSGRRDASAEVARILRGIAKDAWADAVRNDRERTIEPVYDAIMAATAQHAHHVDVRAAAKCEVLKTSWTDCHETDD